MFRLTNDESRERWEKYGNLNGPIEMKYGIALPIFLLSDKTPPTVNKLKMNYNYIDYCAVLCLCTFRNPRFNRNTNKFEN